MGWGFSQHPESCWRLKQRSISFIVNSFLSEFVSGWLGSTQEVVFSPLVGGSFSKIKKKLLDGFQQNFEEDGGWMKGENIRKHIRCFKFGVGVQVLRSLNALIFYKGTFFHYHRPLAQPCSLLFNGRPKIPPPHFDKLQWHLLIWYQNPYKLISVHSLTYFRVFMVLI